MLNCLSRTILIGLATASFSAFAQTSAAPASGLGQAWPNARDVSSSSQYHVYVFVRDGVEYVQINDLNGNVLTALGAAGGQFIVLPIGQAQTVTPSGQATQSQAKLTSRTNAMTSTAPQVVYQDSTLQVTASSQGNGATVFYASGCSDPVECNTHINNDGTNIAN